MKPKFKTVLGLAASVTVLCSMPAAYGDLLYQWNFNNSDGANTGTGTGGTLMANVGLPADPAPTGSFTQVGASGETWDHSLRTSNASDYWYGTDAGNAVAVSNLDLSTVNQFTITMWVKRSGNNYCDLLNIGSTTTPVSSSNPGISVSLNGNWDNGIRVGVNGYNGWTGDLWGPGRDGDWVFMAIAYDGTATDAGSNPTMSGLYGSTNNAAVITGTPTSGAVVAANPLVFDGNWTTPTLAGLPSVGGTATAYLGSDGLNANGFSGNLDDVRIYNGLLTVEEIEAVRQEAFAEPAPSVDLYWKGDLDASWTSANWATGLDGTGSGQTLPIDGSMGIAFSTTDATNLFNVLGGEQNVRNIVATAGSGAVDVSGFNNLTIGEGGIWLEPTAGGLSIGTLGLTLGADQTWKNKSPNPLTVSSPLSGAGSLTKGGIGVLRLGGDGSLRTGGTIVELGTVALDHPNALGGPSASLTMNGGTLDLNGNGVTLGALFGSGEGIIHNTSATPVTLTLGTSSDITYSCMINDGPGGGAVSLVKEGAGTVTASSGSNFTGPVVINGGQFIANQPYWWGAPISGSLGNAQVQGRTITVNSPGTLALTNVNIFGGNTGGDPAKLPEIIVNETEMSSTGYNLIGNVTLNAATLSQSAANTDNWKGYQFKGNVTVTGFVGPSTITGGTGNHLSSNTVFNVEDVPPNSTEADLTIDAPLTDQSGDFASEAGGLTKNGFGIMLVTGVCSYTGDTNVNEGILETTNPMFSDTGALRVSALASIKLSFVGTDVVGALELGGVEQTFEGTYGAPGSGADVESIYITGTGLIELQPAVDAFAEWIAGYPDITGPDAERGADADHDGLTNIQEFAFNSLPDDATPSGKARAGVETVGADQALVLTLPVLDGATFSGNSPAVATLEDEQLTYNIDGTNDMATFDQAVSEVVPALSEGLPLLDAGWSYRSFRLDGNVGGATPRGPKGFLRAAVIDNQTP